MVSLRPVVLLLVTSLIVLSIDGVVGNPTPREIAQLCVRTCDCEIYHKQNKAHLQVRCNQVEQFPAIYPGNTSVVILNNSPLLNLTADALQDKNLEQLEDFQCSNCMLKDIDRTAFRGLSELQSIDLSGNLLVELTADTFVDQKNLVVLNLVGNEDLDCEAFLKKFGEWRPKVKVECDAPASKGDVTTPPSSNLMQRNDVVIGDDEKKDIILEDETLMDDAEKPPVTDRALSIATQPPEADPSTFFPPWTIAVIVIIGAIIVLVAGYYVWNKWTEIRSCCCGQYRQPGAGGPLV